MPNYKTQPKVHIKWTKVIQGRWPIDWKLQQKWEQLDYFVVDKQIKSVWKKHFPNLPTN